MLDLRNLNVSYGDVPAVRDVSLHLNPGSIGCLVGPSGCGKTSVLRAIAGFETPAGGEVWIDGRRVASAGDTVPPEKRRVGMVLQDLALFPHLTVAENIAFGIRHLHSGERSRRVGDLLELIGLHDLASSYPHQLSGGQQQRVAIARAMAPRPKLLLLDEPFSSLDPELRETLPRELRRIFRGEQATVLLVTHDQTEAFAMADELGVIRNGRLEQWDTAYRLYHRPATRFVADFIGEGVMLPGRILDTHRVETELGILTSQRSLDPPADEPVDVLLRPDDVVCDDESLLQARILGRTFRGAHFLYTLALDSGQQVLCLVGSHHDYQPGERIGIRTEIDHLVFFTRSGPGLESQSESAVTAATR